MKRLTLRARIVSALAVLLMVAVILLAVAKPADVGGAHTPEFVALSAALGEAEPGREIAALSLDALDHNVARVRQGLGDGFRLRLVTKSLPSLELVRYLMKRAGTRRLMVFTEPFLAELLANLEPPVDIMLGKPLPVAAAGRLLTRSPEAVAVQWLVDSPARIERYLALAEERELRLRITIEVDVGLRRGGAKETDELLAMLALIAANSERLTFAGLMGYDGHVPYAPALVGSQADAVHQELLAVHERYTTFVAAGRAAHPDLFAGELTFNSGGSRTYFMYDADFVAQTPVNDIAVGSGFLATSAFADLRARDHQPALYFATPVIKKKAVAQIPFSPGMQQWLARWDPNMAVHFVMLNGGFPGDVVSPPGLFSNPFTGGAHGGVRNLVSNQDSRNGSTSVALDEGDYIFFDPWEADAVAWCEKVTLLRAGEVIGDWKTFRGGA